MQFNNAAKGVERMMANVEIFCWQMLEPNVPIIRVIDGEMGNVTCI